MACAANWNLPGATEKRRASVKDSGFMIATPHRGAGNGDVLAHMSLSYHTFVCTQSSDFQAQVNFSWTRMILSDPSSLTVLIIAQHSLPADLPFSMCVNH